MTQKEQFITKWKTLLEKRNDWVANACHEYRESLHPDLKNAFSDSRQEVFVTLYGKSQVGKTTLILKILNIRDEYMSVVSKALRGRSPSGNSSTSTPVFYKKSSDNTWRIKEGEDCIEDDDAQEIETFFEKKRKLIKEKEIHSELLYVSIWTAPFKLEILKA